MMNQGLRRLPVLIAVLVGAALAASCAGNGKQQKRIKQLNMLIDSVAGATQLLQSPPPQEVMDAFEWADQSLREFELLLADSLVAISREEGAIISEVSRARRLMKDQAKRRQALGKSAERAQFQMTALARAMETNATIDALGSPMDSAYYETQFLRETEISRQLIVQLEETQDLAIRGCRTQQQVRPASDSLQTVLRARLARAILEEKDR